MSAKTRTRGNYLPEGPRGYDPIVEPPPGHDDQRTRKSTGILKSLGVAALEIGAAVVIGKSVG